MSANPIEKHPLHRRKHFVDRNFQLFDEADGPSSSNKTIESKGATASTTTTRKPEFHLSVHHKEGLEVDNGLRLLMSLLKRCRARETHVKDARSSVHIKGLDNVYYRTRKPLHTRDVCQYLHVGMPVWLCFTTNCDPVHDTVKSKENDLIDYSRHERLHYGYRGRLQREQFRLKQAQRCSSDGGADAARALTSVGKNLPLSTMCHLVTVGSFRDCGTYVAHASTIGSLDRFELEFRCVPPSICVRSLTSAAYINSDDDRLYNKTIYSVVIGHESIESHLILNHQNEFVDLFIPLLHSIKPMKEIELDELGTRQRTRSTRFHRFHREHIAQASVVHLRVPLLNTASKMINDLADRLNENNIRLLFGNVRIVHLPDGHVHPYANLQFDNYLCNYAWHMLISLGACASRCRLTMRTVRCLCDVHNRRRFV
jgi:hypothetical protein